MGFTDQKRLSPLGRALQGCVNPWGSVVYDMYRSDWWKTVPAYEEPKPVSGEIPWK